MCPDPLDMFLNPRSPLLWMLLGTVTIFVIGSFVLTSHPTFTDAMNEYQHVIHYLNRSDFGTIPNYYIVGGIIITSIIISIIFIFRGIKEDKEMESNKWKTWHELMFNERMFHHEAEEYYYGDISI